MIKHRSSTWCDLSATGESIWNALLIISELLHQLNRFSSCSWTLSKSHLPSWCIIKRAFHVLSSVADKSQHVPIELLWGRSESTCNRKRPGAANEHSTNALNCAGCPSFQNHQSSPLPCSRFHLTVQSKAVISSYFPDPHINFPRLPQLTLSISPLPAHFTVSFVPLVLVKGTRTLITSRSNTPWPPLKKGS